MARKQDRIEKIAALVTELAQETAALEAAEAVYAAEEEKLMAEVTAKLEQFKTPRDTHQAKVNELRETLKEEGLKVDKAELHPALTLKSKASFEWDDAAMFQWCVLFNPSLLELNRGNIEQHINWIRSRKSQTKKYFGLDGSKPLVPMPVTIVERLDVEIKNSQLPNYAPKPEPEEQAEAKEPEAPPTETSEPTEVKAEAQPTGEQVGLTPMTKEEITEKIEEGKEAS